MNAPGSRSFQPSDGAGEAPEDAGDAGRADHLGFVAHEVRNPLAAALWSAELLARLSPEERGGARGQKLASTGLRSLLRLRRLIEDHLLAERLDADGFAICLEALPAADLLPDDPGALGAAALEADLEPGLLLEADPTLARRALEGAVLAAAREGGVVRVEGRRWAGGYRFRVAGARPVPGALADPGRGSASDPRGASISLAVGRRAAAAFGASLRVEGDAFVLLVPVAYEAAAADGSPAAHGEGEPR